MKIMKDMKHIGKQWSERVLLMMLFLHLPMVFSLSNYILPSILGGAGGVSLLAQDVSITVQPVSYVLPPQAGSYLADPGKYFSVKLLNETDEQQLVHIGMHVEMVYPDQEVMVGTPANGHIPRQPIVLAPRQAKTLNPVEMRNLFRHFSIDEIGISERLYKSQNEEVTGLLPEGQYDLYLQAYKWDPDLTQPVQLNSPDNGQCHFVVCYEAQAPRFLTPVSIPSFADDALSMLAVTRLDVNQPVQSFTWTPPTLNCNASLVSFNYDVKIVKLDDQMPDEAIEKNAVAFQRTHLSTPTLTLPAAYYSQWSKDTTTIYAIQVTAHSLIDSEPSDLNFSLIENGGKSEIMLFRFYDPSYKPIVDDGEMDFSFEDGSVKYDSNDSLYVFEQPTLIKPVFSSKTARKVFVGDSILVAWRKAWFSGGQGQKQDTVKFEYNVALYKGLSSDTPEGIFTSQPVYTKKTTSLNDTIRWDKLKGKVESGDYLMVRVTAKSTNEKSLRFLPDSLNYKDFALTEHFEETYSCGNNTSQIENKKTITEKPKKGTVLYINEWPLTLNDDVKMDSESHALSGTGWISWNAADFRVRVAVKFDELMVNTDGIVFEGKCLTYPKENSLGNDFTAEQAVDSLFSDWGLDNVWGDLGLPSDVAQKVGGTVDGEIDNVAKKYELGKYYSYFKTAENQWNNWKQGDWLDIYVPIQLPDTIAQLLPDDLSIQIASMIYTPQGAMMNLIGEFALPETDVLDNDVLIFGMPRMCVSQNQLLPEDGTLALLSNFRIKDPYTDWSMTFVAPTEPLNPQDGCFLQWENNDFSGLGVEIAMTIPNLKRVVDGKAQDVPPVLDLQATIKDNWGDWIGRIHMDPFEVEDLPGWTFSPGKDIIFDHSYEENYQGNNFHFPTLAQMPGTYDPSQVNSYCKNDWDAWQGIYIDDISVSFPKWAVFGGENDGLKISGQKMFFDNSGVTCDIAALNLITAKTGKAGGWEFDLDQAKVMITQNNFDSCHIEGRFAIPLFGEKDSLDVNKGKVRFTCDIRHLTDGETTYYTYNHEGKREAHKKKTYGENARMAYLFKTQQIDNLDFRSFVADVVPTKEQTYLVVAAEDKEDGTTDTYVELNMAGQINIADSNSTVNYVRNYARKLPLNMDFRGIHFAKMRLSNFAYADTARVYRQIDALFSDSLGTKRIQAEKAWENEHSGRWVAFENKEMKLTEKCFLDLGEWSLTSPEKKIGPFMVGIREFKPDYSSADQKLSLGIEGVIGFCDDKVTAAVGIDISTKLTIPKDYTNISGYSLSDGKVEFRSVEVKADLGMLTLDGRLEVEDNEKFGKGYGGTLNLEIKELFKVDVKGGYYQIPDKDQNDGYAWGFFTANLNMDAKTSPLRFDPLVITRISGGFYFNCRPVYEAKTATFGDPEPKHGMVGVSFGLGLAATAGEETLSGDMDLNVIYDQDQHRLTTFMFKGQVQAVSGIVDAKMQLLYQNDDQERFLALDITVEAGFESGLSDAMGDLNKTLQAEKAKLDEFQASLDQKVKEFQSDPMGSLAALNSDYENKTSEEDKKKNEEKGTTHGDAQANQQIKQNEMTEVERKKVEMGQVKIALNMKITWREKGVEKTPVKWHLYLGEPDKDKRCKIILLDFKSRIVSVNIGADAYLCLGNELPGDGQLPPIPTEITEFLNGGSSSVNTNADLSRAENSRSKAVRALTGSVNGGVMVGASAWGYINIDLGLFYGSLKALAGFDISLVNYRGNAYCVNLNRAMGRDGWYAMGQFYAYLAAKFGLHIKLGKLIDKRIDIVDAGIGGVFECGMPSPTWIEGRARIKLNLLGGLIKINKRFDFDCGDRCQVFRGNALDNFSLFDNCTLGEDSIDTGWDMENAISTREATRAMLTTTASLNSQYRLVDPNTLYELGQQSSADDEKLELQASRTYIFDMDGSDNGSLGKLGVRLFELNSVGYENMMIYRNGYLKAVLREIGSSFETNILMKDKSLTSAKVKDDRRNTNYNNFINILKGLDGVTEVPVSVREKQGTKYHLNLQLKPNRRYLLALTGTAFEVENGERVWPLIVQHDTIRDSWSSDRQQWIQRKLIYFCTTEQQAVPEVVENLQPYVALAYPSARGNKLFNEPEDNAQAYLADLRRPTIALNEDIHESTWKNGQLEWTLSSRLAGSTDFVKSETKQSVWIVNSNSVNMAPLEAFSPVENDRGKTYEHNLRLTYTFQIPAEDCPAMGMAEKAQAYLSFFMTQGTTHYNKVMQTIIAATAASSSSSDTPGNKTHSNMQIEEETITIGTQQVSAHVVCAAATSYMSDKSLLQKKWRAYYANLQQKRQAECTRDSVVTLANLWFRQAKGRSWKSVYYNTGNETLPLLDYEAPFVGVRPATEPTYSYDSQTHYTENSRIDYSQWLAGQDNQLIWGGPYDNSVIRLKDPYAYFAYLSNFVFIAGRAVNAYAFDDVKIPHATETLTLSYNTSDVAGADQVEGMARITMDLRDQMYKTWNDWYYNDDAQPYYPLPTRLGEDYEVAMANQDGKAASYMPAYVQASTDYPYHVSLADYVKDFAAPYYIAQELSTKMKEVAGEIYSYYYNQRMQSKNNNYELNSGDYYWIDYFIKQWNNLHRGQYLRVESRGMEVKVPYYQFPLIFGDCFGHVNGKEAVDPTFANYTTKTIERGDRSFGSSMVKKLAGNRWESDVSSLLFARLIGRDTWFPPTSYTPQGKCFSYNQSVECDAFNATNALQNVKKLDALIYRVDTYNINTGLYEASGMGAAREESTNDDYADFTQFTRSPMTDRPHPSGLSTLTDWINIVGQPEVKVDGVVVNKSPSTSTTTTSSSSTSTSTRAATANTTR